MDSDFQQELRSQAAILEGMFQDPALQALRRRYPKHPAVERYDLLRAFLEGGRIAFSKELALLRAMAAMMFDRSTWATTPPQDDYWSFVTDPAQRARAKELAKDPNQFGDLMAEVFVWGLLVSAGIRTRWVEQPGLPDLALAVGSADDLWADVKHIRLGSAVDRIQDHIAKANRQIKAASARAGLVFIHIDRQPERAALDDRTPSDVRSFV